MIKHTASFVVAGVASAMPVTAYADCYSRLIEFECDRDTGSFSARTFGSYDIGCNMDDDVPGLMTLRQWSEKPIVCPLVQTSPGRGLADFKVNFTVTKFRPSAPRGMCAGADSGEASFAINGTSVVEMGQTHGYCSPEEHSLVMANGIVEHCKIDMDRNGKPKQSICNKIDVLARLAE